MKKQEQIDKARSGLFCHVKMNVWILSNKEVIMSKVWFLIAMEWRVLKPITIIDVTAPWWFNGKPWRVCMNVQTIVAAHGSKLEADCFVNDVADPNVWRHCIGGGNAGAETFARRALHWLICWNNMTISTRFWRLFVASPAVVFGSAWFFLRW